MIENTASLRMAILKSIKLPFNSTDTIVLNCAAAWSICGLSTQEEISHIIWICLDQKPYIRLLSKRLNVPIISIEDYWRNVSNTSEIKRGIDPFEKDKVRATVRAEINKKNGEVIVNEYYEQGKKVSHFRKEFYYDGDGKWNLRVN